MNNLEIAINGVKIASRILKIPTPEVNFISVENLPNKEITAVFTFEEYEIIFNKDWVLNVPWIEVMVTCFHETRHAYQYLQIIKSSTLKFIEQELVLTEWKRGFETYQMPESNKFSLYLKNPIEIDAIAFSTLLVERLFKTTVSVPVSIRQDVIIRRRQIKEVMSLDYFDKD